MYARNVKCVAAAVCFLSVHCYCEDPSFCKGYTNHFLYGKSICVIFYTLSTARIVSLNMGTFAWICALYKDRISYFNFTFNNFFFLLRTPWWISSKNISLSGTLTVWSFNRSSRGQASSSLGKTCFCQLISPLNILFACIWVRNVERVRS